MTSPRILLPAILLAVILLAPSNSHAACPTCAGAGTGALSWTDERYYIDSSLVVRREIGHWDVTGRARGVPSNVRAFDALWQIAGVVRPVQRLELAATISGGLSAIDAPGLSERMAALGDFTGRARFELALDSMPEHRLASGAWLAVRAPTGSLASSRGGTASGIGAFSLGTWEVAVGADVRRRFGTRLQPFAAVEIAARLPDQSLGVTRALGPRGGARVGLAYFLRENLVLSALLESNLESNVAIRGQVLSGTWQQRTTVGISLSARSQSGVHASVLVAGDVLVDDLGRNADATLRAGFSFGWGAINPAWAACHVHSGHMARSGRVNGRERPANTSSSANTAGF